MGGEQILAEWGIESIVASGTKAECKFCSSVMEIGNVKAHIDGATHKKKRFGKVWDGQEVRVSKLQMPPLWIQQGLRITDTNEIECPLCNTVMSYGNAELHLQGKMHQNKLAKNNPAAGNAPAKDGNEANDWYSNGWVDRDGAQKEAAKDSTSRSNYNQNWLQIESIEDNGGLLFCKLCNAGPFSTEDVAWAHVKGKKHQGKKANEVDENEIAEYEKQGISYDKSTKRFRCVICHKDLGISPDQVSAHLRGKTHEKALLNPKTLEEAEKTELKINLQNLPLSLSFYGDDLWCDHCCVLVGDEKQAADHMKGPSHKKKEQNDALMSDMRFPPCVSLARLRCNTCDVAYDNRRDLMVHLGTKLHLNRTDNEFLLDPNIFLLRSAKTGKKFMRPGIWEYKWPEKLPPGWRAFADPSSMLTYYWNIDTSATQWERPS